MSDQAVEPSTPALSLNLSMYRDMVRTRELNVRMFALNRQGRVPFAISGTGHEAAQVGSAYAIKRGTDWVLPYYRDVGVMISLGMAPRDVMLHLYARADDPNSGGRQMPNHWSWPEARVVTRSSLIAANLPHAAGIAYASRLRGLDEVSIVYFGEGATSEGDFHEAMNFAAIHRLPVVFFCENNGYAISESTEKQMPVRHVADRARAYDMVGVTVDGNDLLAVHQTTRWSVEECRRGHGPSLIEAITYRTDPHTTADDDRRYRPREEVEEWARNDPLDRFRDVLMDEGTLSAEENEQLLAAARSEIDEAVEQAEHAPDPTPESALRYVFHEEHEESVGHSEGEQR